MFSLGEKLLDGGCDGRWFGVGSISLNDVTLLVDKEFGEVPLDHLGTKNASLFLLEELEDLVGVTAVDIGFGHHRESYTVVTLAELADGFIAPWILTSKLVAREPNDLQTLVSVLFVELLKLSKLGSISALGGGVDN